MKKILVTVLVSLVIVAGVFSLTKYTDYTGTLSMTFINRDSNSQFTDMFTLNDLSNTTLPIKGMIVAMKFADVVSSGAGEAAVDTGKMRILFYKDWMSKTVLGADTGCAPPCSLSTMILFSDSAKAKYFNYDQFRLQAYSADTAGSGTNDTNTVSVQYWVRLLREQ